MEVYQLTYGLHSFKQGILNTKEQRKYLENSVIYAHI